MHWYTFWCTRCSELWLWNYKNLNLEIHGYEKSSLIDWSTFLAELVSDNNQSDALKDDGANITKTPHPCNQNPENETSFQLGLPHEFQLDMYVKQIFHNLNFSTTWKQVSHKTPNLLIRQWKSSYNILFLMFLDLIGFGLCLLCWI